MMMMMMMTLTTLPELAEMYGLLRLPAAFRLLAEPAQGLSATRLSVRARLVLRGVLSQMLEVRESSLQTTSPDEGERVYPPRTRRGCDSGC